MTDVPTHAAAEVPARIRPATPDDAEEVLRLARVLAVTFRVEDDAFDTSFAAALTTPGSHLLVAESDGAVRGYLLGFLHPSFFANGSVGWVEEIVVATEHRRYAIGSQLMAEFERRCAAAGGSLVALATRRAHRFYRSLGYVEHGAFHRKIL